MPGGGCGGRGRASGSATGMGRLWGAEAAGSFLDKSCWAEREAAVVRGLAYGVLASDAV